ncbi:hypothetical protein V6N13_044389 [Hibiscus sabdariffa]
MQVVPQTTVLPKFALVTWMLSCLLLHFALAEHGVMKSRSCAKGTREWQQQLRDYCVENNLVSFLSSHQHQKLKQLSPPRIKVAFSMEIAKVSAL